MKPNQLIRKGLRLAAIAVLAGGISARAQSVLSEFANATNLGAAYPTSIVTPIPFDGGAVSLTPSVDGNADTLFSSESVALTDGIDFSKSITSDSRALTASPEVPVVPEPSTLALAGMAALGVLRLHYRRR